MVAPLIDPARPHLSHQLHAATTRRRNDRQAITPVHQAGESGNGADTPPQSPHPPNRHNISPPNEHPPHGVGVQDPPAATRSASGRSRTPPPYRRATKPSREHRNEDQRVATSGLDRPHSFRNDLSRPGRTLSGWRPKETQPPGDERSREERAPRASRSDACVAAAVAHLVRLRLRRRGPSPRGLAAAVQPDGAAAVAPVGKGAGSRRRRRPRRPRAGPG